MPYLNFEGRIPDGEYGAGEVRIWDRGNYELVDNRDMNVGMEEGKLSFILHGKKLVGEFRMIRLRSRSTERNNQWLLMKKKDSFANDEFVLQRILDYGSRTKRADH